jgi:glycosyltransferase involved in cell wall biosynthesis
MSIADRNPLVSVIVPCFNHGTYLKEAIESVQRQTYKNWELIVVDDGSTDNTREVTEHFSRSDSRVKYVWQTNSGLSAARNLGIAHSSGKYIQLLDADDHVEAEKLSRQVDYLEQHPRSDIVYSEARYFPDGNPTERRYSMHEADRPWMPLASDAGPDIFRHLVRANMFAVNCPLIRRTVTEQVGPFDVALPLLEDWDYWIRCAAMGMRFDYLNADETFALVRIRPASSSKNKAGMMNAKRLLQKKLRSIKHDATVNGFFEEIVRNLDVTTAIDEVMTGKKLRGAFGLFRAGLLNTNPRWLFYGVAAPLVSKATFDRLINVSLSAPLNSRSNALK